MPRRSHVREYDEEDLFDDDDREPIPPPRSRRGRRHEPDLRYNMRAPSPPTPMEEFERMELRDRSAPEFLPEDFEPPRERRPLPVRREHNGIGVPPRELVRNFERARGEARRRGHPSRQVFMDEEYGSPVEPESGPEPEKIYVDSDSEGELPPVSRRERSLPRHRREIREELVPRSKSQKDGRRVRRSRVEREDVHPRPSEIRDEIRDARGHHRHHRASRSHPASGYQTDVYESTDDIPEEDFMMKKGRRRRRDLDRDRLEEEEFIQDRGMSSSEMDDPRMPSPVRMPPNPRDYDAEHLHIREEYGVPRAPRPPSPEVSFEKPKSRHHKGSGRASREEVVLETREKDITPIPVRALSPEPPIRRKEEIAIPISRPRSLEREKDVLIRERGLPKGDLVEEREVIEEAYNEGMPERAPKEIVTKDMAEDWAIVNASAKPREGPRENQDFDRGKIGRRYVGVKDRRDRLWTEITKDLVVKEAIERMGFEYEETVSSYYVFSYLQYDDVSSLVELSEDIRRARRRRIHEMERERASKNPPPVAVPEKGPPLLLDRPMSPPRRSREGRKMKERELVVEDRGRPRSGRR
ncbi:hypothetical protein P170DRAFT_439613 [Aspergillus steynii IBT 23096]|uniref:DUF8035 domain-containing protein n=1 Tax=Aspergillus steynii IBT 23096 TaxID=1392250 RepID=A0A2I2FZ53_9EURO|nr:uncharacterized protein P170DRAFT_439613 [Aspergillus steynii IBT 23096]PLB45914.1 hypothetical protein P170DRAFT_439613 [Aspergillus steynii IBT 23096]